MLTTRLAKFIIVKKVGETPKCVSPEGVSVWFWDENEEQTDENLKVSDPIISVNPVGTEMALQLKDKEGRNLFVAVNDLNFAFNLYNKVNEKK